MMIPKSSSAATSSILPDWIEEELILSLPLVPAHEEGCQTDGPEESKDEVQKPNPFAKLKDLKGLRKV